MAQRKGLHPQCAPEMGHVSNNRVWIFGLVAGVQGEGAEAGKDMYISGISRLCIKMRP